MSISAPQPLVARRGIRRGLGWWGDSWRLMMMSTVHDPFSWRYWGFVWEWAFICTFGFAFVSLPNLWGPPVLLFSQLFFMACFVAGVALAAHARMQGEEPKFLHLFKEFSRTAVATGARAAVMLAALRGALFVSLVDSETSTWTLFLSVGAVAFFVSVNGLVSVVAVFQRKGFFQALKCHLKAWRTDGTAMLSFIFIPFLFLLLCALMASYPYIESILLSEARLRTGGRMPVICGLFIFGMPLLLYWWGLTACVVYRDFFPEESS